MTVARSSGFKASLSMESGADKDLTVNGYWIMAKSDQCWWLPVKYRNCLPWLLTWQVNSQPKPNVVLKTSASGKSSAWRAARSRPVESLVYDGYGADAGEGSLAIFQLSKNKALKSALYSYPGGVAPILTADFNFDGQNDILMADPMVGTALPDLHGRSEQAEPSVHRRADQQGET